MCLAENTKFATATAKASKACFVSDLSECDTTTSSKERKQKKTFRDNIDTESESESESERETVQDIPLHPDINNFNEIDIATCPIIISMFHINICLYIVINVIY